MKKLLAEQLLAIGELKEIAGKNANPAARRQALEILKSKGFSERAACRFAGVSRRVANYELKQPAKDQALGAQLIEGSSRYPRFGYRRTAVMTGTKVSRVWRL